MRTALKARILTPSYQVTIGGRTPNEILRLYSKVSPCVYVPGESFREMFRNNALRAQTTKEVINLVVLTPRGMGFNNRPLNHMIFNPRFLRDWSVRFLAGQSIELCPMEVAYYLPFKYKEGGPRLWVASFPLREDVDHSLFCVDYKRCPVLELVRMEEGRQLRLNSQIVFQLKNGG